MNIRKNIRTNIRNNIRMIIRKKITMNIDDIPTNLMTSIQFTGEMQI